jgi:hypothetical protein
MSSLLQAPAARHLGPCSLLDVLSRQRAPDNLEAYGRPALTRMWRFRDVEPINNPG